ncbi:hypothetical protein [Mucilaginibacter polytrichastri]|uniref:DUF4386 domain-containing protein n=1 Tax=Mucilaginibacter polytrichastri TaxID=1302689 RepID=A0A1Q5ZSQ8_9SPHI|nr:hypothetical protein [Mucilaginibacter polytrichastri]OKS84777.1 hypothetical protein RG47T_0210 [Mucilaginibacter polytrichastri]SFT00432.1 hypothetical protein SAMN04487890_10831 [Mucilaginibacter polytrichastri]
MQSSTFSLRSILAVLLVLFPVLMMLAFAIHFGSLHAFFDFRLSRKTYNSGGLFDALVSGRGHGFIMAHSVAFLTVPLFMITTGVLSWFLYLQKPLLAFTGAAIGLIGCTALAAVFGAWLSFSGIQGLDQQYYAGARQGFIQLVQMKGMLKFITLTSYLSFIGLGILAAGLAWVKQFNLLNMLCIIIGVILFVTFMDMDNWMFIGSIFLLIGFVPVSRRLKNGNDK